MGWPAPGHGVSPAGCGLLRPEFSAVHWRLNGRQHRPIFRPPVLRYHIASGERKGVANRELITGREESTLTLHLERLGDGDLGCIGRAITGGDGKPLGDAGGPFSARPGGAEQPWPGCCSGWIPARMCPSATGPPARSAAGCLQPETRVRAHVIQHRRRDGKPAYGHAPGPAAQPAAVLILASKPRSHAGIRSIEAI